MTPLVKQLQAKDENGKDAIEPRRAAILAIGAYTRQSEIERGREREREREREQGSERGSSSPGAPPSSPSVLKPSLALSRSPTLAL